jgi:hypothetical protein
MRTRPRLRYLTLCLAFALAGQSQATMLKQLNLQELAASAEKVFRGRVVGIETTTVTAGGGQLPVTIYRLKVGEQFKGAFASPKGEAVIEVRMIGTAKARGPVNGQQRLSPFHDVPQLAMGQEYVLFTTRPSSVGLSTTVGLGQGAFKVDSTTKDESTVNAFGNQGLNARLGAPVLPASGPVAYTTFATAIRAVLTQVRP